EKRRDSYILRLKLRAGTSGALGGNSVQTQSESPRVDAQSQRALTDELVPAVDAIKANHGGGSDAEEDDEEEAPAKKKKKTVEDEEEAPPPKKSGFSKKKSVEDEEEEVPSKSKKKKGADE